MPSTPPPKATQRRALIAVVAAIGACIPLWIGLSMHWASRARNHRTEVALRLEGAAELARDQADQMMVIPYSSLELASSACVGKLDDKGLGSLMFVVRIEPVASLATLGAASAPRASERLFAIGPAGQLEARSTVPRSDQVDSYVWRMVFTPPWQWESVVESSAEWAQEAGAMRRVAVVLMREGTVPGVNGAMGRKAGYHVRVVDLSGKVECDGRFEGPSRSGVDSAADGEGSVHPVDSAVALELCLLNGGAKTCDALREALPSR